MLGHWVQIVEVDQALDERVGVVVRCGILSVSALLGRAIHGGRRRREAIPCRPHGRDLRCCIFAFWAVLDSEADSLLDTHPMVVLCNGGRRLVDPAMLASMDLSCDLVLPLWVCNDFLVLQHQPLLTVPILLSRDELVVRRRTSQAALLSAVGAVGVFAVLEVEADLVETLFRDEVFTLGAKVAAVDDGINEVVRVGPQVAAGFNAPDAFEAKGVPDTAGGDVGFVNEVEDGVGVALVCTSITLACCCCCRRTG